MKHVLQHAAVLSVVLCIAAARFQDPASTSKVQELPKVQELRAILDDRLSAAKITCQRLTNMPIGSVSEMDTLALWSHRLAQASVDAGVMTTREALTEHLGRMEVRLTVASSLEKEGRVGEYEMAFVRFHVAEARRLVEQTQGK